MSTISVKNPHTGEVIPVRIAGQSPTPAEQQAIANFFRQQQPPSPAADPLALARVQSGVARRPSESAPPPERASGPIRLSHARGVLPAVGGGVGAVAGTGLSGGNPIGGLLLGMGLAGVGGAAEEALFETARQTGLAGPGGFIIDDVPDRTISEAGRQEQLLEGAVQAVAPGAGALVRGGSRVLAGTVKPAARKAAAKLRADAERVGAPLGIDSLDTVTAPAFRVMRRIFGPFFFIGGPFKKADKERAEALGAFLADAEDRIFPITRNFSETGRDLSVQTFRRSKAIRNRFRDQYSHFWDRAQAQGVRIPTASVKAVAADLIEQTGEEAILVPGKGGSVPSRVRRSLAAANLAADIRKWPDVLTPKQFDGAKKAIGEMIQRTAGKNRNLAAQFTALEQAIKQDSDNVIHPDPRVQEQFRQELSRLNRRFSDFMSLLESPTGRRFLRANRRFFDVGLERNEIGVGSTPADRMFSLVFDGASPQAMRELRALTGRKAFRQALRFHIENSLKGAVDTGGTLTGNKAVVNLKTLEDLIGADGPKREALAEALRVSGTGVKIGDLDAFFRVAQASFRDGTIDLSKFAARRAVLGGIRSGVRALVPGSAVAGDVGGGLAGAAFDPGSAGAVLAIRNLGRVVTGPKTLRLATQAIDTSLERQTRNRAFTRLAFLLGEPLPRNLVTDVPNFLANRLRDTTGAEE